MKVRTRRARMVCNAAKPSGKRARTVDPTRTITLRRAHIAIGAQNARQGAAGAEIAGHDAHRHAGVAAGAGRPIDETMAAAKADLAGGVVELLGVLAIEFGGDAALEAAGQVGAGPRPRAVKKLKLSEKAAAHARSLPRSGGAA